MTSSISKQRAAPQPSLRSLLADAGVEARRRARSGDDIDAAIAQILEAVWLADVRRNNEPAPKKLRALRLAAHKYLESARENERWGLRVTPSSGVERAAAVRQLLQSANKAKQFLAGSDASTRVADIRGFTRVEPSDRVQRHAPIRSTPPVAFVVARSLIQTVAHLGLDKGPPASALADKNKLAKWRSVDDDAKAKFAEWLNENHHNNDHEAIARRALQACGVPRVSAKNSVDAAARNG